MCYTRRLKRMVRFRRCTFTSRDSRCSRLLFSSPSNEIEVTTRSTLKFAEIRDLEPLGVDRDKYPALLYERTQEIGDAAAFLGFDGVISPSARWDCLNLAIFCDELNPEDLVLRNSIGIDWKAWRKRHGKA